MHELSIVMSIIEIAEKETSHEDGIIEEIELDIGKLSTIEMDAFDFAWQQAVKNTILQDAQRRVNRLEGRAKCMDCELEFPMENLYDNCPVCRGYFNQVVQGKELRVRSISVVCSR